MVRRGLLALTLLAVAGLFPALAADDSNALKTIMQGLRDNLVEVTDGLLSGNRDQLAAGADSIADHPHIPPADVQLIAAGLGPEMAAFKQFDMLVHESALKIAAAARAGDNEAAIAAYRKMTDGCLIG